MADWTRSMIQTFEYYTVDPTTWKDRQKLDTVKSCTINWDSSAETLGSATIDIDNFVGEVYIRVYMTIIQNGVKERFPLGTFIAQSPSISFDGMVKSVSLDAYTPLMELKENAPPIGYSLLKDYNVMNAAYSIANEHARAPVIKTSTNDKLYSHFVSGADDTWLKYLSDLVSTLNYRLNVDEMGRIMFDPIQPLDSMQPVWTYSDDNSSILFSTINWDNDLYGIPNVVEVVYSNGEHTVDVRVVNDDPDSLTSTVSRGREIIKRVVNPEDLGKPTDEMIKEYAEKLLKSSSTITYTINYTHGYCPVRVGDCVRMNYKRAGLVNIKGKVISQSINCEPGCSVSEKAIFIMKLWR